MKKLLVVLGLSAIAMAGKCSSDKAKEETKTPEEFPVKEESQVPAEEVPSYEQQEEATPGSSTTTPGSSTTTPEATPAPAGESAPETVPTPAPSAPTGN